ncbi:MAG: EAL domain-containing protein [Wenzhouxiangellaceae bacterium]
MANYINVYHQREKGPEMIAPTPEHYVLSLDSQVLPCRMAVQHICRSVRPEINEWTEFLVRSNGGLSHLSPLDFVEQGYKRRGLLFDEDIVLCCLDAVAQLPSTSWFSINIHPNSLHRERFVEFLRGELEYRDIDPNRVILELVEFGGPVNLMASRSAMDELRDEGIRFALDDFGPGFSNLDLIGSNLVDFVKLDRSLVRFIDVQSGYTQLIQGLQALADQTDVVLVAEGVETESQARIVRQIGVEWIQGFHYSRPAMVEANEQQ